VLKILRVGAGPDAVILDTRRELAFIPSGGSGTLTVISLRNPDQIRELHETATRRGTRTGALDPETGRLYLPSARFVPRPGSHGLGEPVAGSFEILIVGNEAR